MWVIGLVQLRIGIIGEPCECGIEPSGSISHVVSLNTVVEINGGAHGN